MLWTRLEKSTTDAHFLALGLKKSFLLSNVLAAPSDGRDLAAAGGCIVEVSAGSCLTCESGYLMNIVGFVAVVVAVESKQKEKLTDRNFG